MVQKILHFAPDMSARNGLRETIHHTLDSEGSQVSVHIATLTPPATDMSGRYTCHCVGNGRADYGRRVVNMLTLQRRFLVLLYDLMPDLVHIHGSYSHISSRVALWALRRGFPVVFSPYGGLNPSFIDAEYGMRTWKMILYQKSMVERASAVVTSDRAEADYIQHEGMSRRVEYVEAPHADANGYADYDPFASRLCAIYSKVLDTERAKRLNTNSMEAVSALLRLCLADASESHPLCPEDILNLRSLTRTQWRDIHLFGTEHDILPHIDSGVSRMQLRENLPESTWSDRYARLHPKASGPLKSDGLLSGNKRRQRMIDSLTLGGEHQIRRVCLMLDNARHHLNDGSLTLHHLCDIYEEFRYVDIDERRLKEILARVGLLKFCRRLCQVLSECAYLDEGFMPVSKLDDRGTERIRQALACD